jgi:hydrogenase expression/formation protein HypC
VCLGIPGQIVEIIDARNGIAKADVGGVRRNVSLQVLAPEDHPRIGEWVLIHVGFAMAKIDEQEARETYRFLENLGKEYEDELAALEDSRIE